MINIPHKHTTEWDYKGWKNELHHYNPYTQKDWNQTLLTKLNLMSTYITKASFRGGGNRVRCNGQTVELLKTLESYNHSENDSNIANMYRVIVDDLILDNSIYVYSYRIHEKRFLIPNIKLSDNSFETPNGDFDMEKALRELSFKVETDETKEEGDEHRRNLVGKIKILGYEI